MNLSVLTIRRPVLSTVLSVILVLLGVIGYLFLGVRQFPDVDPPNITVTTTYAGANADVIEAQITEPLEESINGIAGIRSLTSQSSDGRSQITVEFVLGEDLEQAANDVRDRVDRAKRNLPPDIDPPIVAKADANSRAILVMTVQSTDRTLGDLTAFATNVLKERLQTIPGVGAITIWGERKYAMRILMDPERLEAFNLTTVDVQRVLAAENVELPAGKLEGTTTELTVRTMGRLSTVEEFSNLILRSVNGATVRLREVATVYLGAENERTILKRDGVPMVGLAMSPQPGANQVQISDEFYNRYEALKKFVPSDIHLNVFFDDTAFVRGAIEEVEETLLIAFSLVVVIIFLFLRSWRATLIPVVAIPVSLIATFFVMWISGFSINVLSLLGVVLATGLVVDDAIVVMENIYRRIEGGEGSREAGEKGATEIFFAIVSTTITLVVVFLPIIFLPGLTGRLFREFGGVVAASVAISAFVSLTLTPMMSSRFLHAHDMDSWLARVTEPFFVWLNNAYSAVLNRVMKAPIIAIIIMVASLVLIWLLGSGLKTELAPLEDRGMITINATAPEGTTFDKMDVVMDSLTATIGHTVPEKRIMLTVTSPSFFGGGNNNGFARVILQPSTERERSQMDIAKGLTGTLRQNNDARFLVMQDPTISTGQRSGLPVQYVLQASELEDLREALPKFLEAAGADPTFTVVDVNLKFTKPEVVVSIDRDRARDQGVSVDDIARVLQAGLAGQRFGYFMRDGKQYQILAEVERNQRATPDNLRSLGVKSASGAILPLASFVKLEERSSPPALYRNDRNVSATISAGLAPGKTIGDGIAAMDKVAASTLDSRFTHTLAGESRDFAESSSSLIWAFLLALVFVYLVLAAQFESFVDPFTIMLTVPLALAGGVLALWITGDTLNIFSEIGAVALIGLITKNGILIVEFANQRMEEGLSVFDAAFSAASSRFRPILMTSLATILGALPIALSLGAASGSRAGLGVVIVGGMLYSTLLSLLVVPALYITLSRLKKH
ncbi:MAG: efflux RND transporter permease subunit [Bradyrhizobiaceae bacterium]|nr:efflux RND transporter permease subunit [Bradyrhizobiaceae bacterium]